MNRYMTRVAIELDERRLKDTMNKRACSHALGKRIRSRPGEQGNEHPRSIDGRRGGSGGVLAGIASPLAVMGRRKSMSAAATRVAIDAKRNLIHTARTKHELHTPSSCRIIWTLASPKLQPHIIPMTDFRLFRAGREGSSAVRIRCKGVAMKRRSTKAYSHIQDASA